MPSASSTLARRIAILGLCVCTLDSGACSYMFVDGPPKQHKQLPYFTCTPGRAWPVVDTVIGSVLGIEAIAALSLASSAGGDSGGVAVAGLVTGGLAALFVASAVSGYGDASECREATEDLQLRLMRMYPGPGFAPKPYAPEPDNDPWVRPTNQPFGASLPTRGARDAGLPDSEPEAPKEER